MTQADPHTLDSVEKLLTERRKIAGWLTALDDRRADTPPTVYQRVHDDYTAKMDKVQARLVAASDAVQLVAADVAGRLVDKEQGLVAKQEERAEAELRAAVGEFSGREWEKRRARLDDEIVAATSERDALRDELSRLRRVLGEVVGEAVLERPELVEPDLPASEPALQPAPEPAEEPAPEPAAQLAPAADEVIESSRESVPAASGPPVIEIQEQSIAAPVVSANPSEPGFDELEFLKATPPRSAPQGPSWDTGDAGRPLVTAEPSRATTGSYTVPEPPLEFPDAIPDPRVSQEMTPPRESFFARPTPRSAEAPKSLKCQECGTLNYPTEWYCERCGGELAAM